MFGTGLPFTRHRGEDRFYNPAKARRAQQNSINEQLRRAKSDVTPSQSSVKQPQESVVVREPEDRTGSNDVPRIVAEPAFEPVLSNVERFLESITPSVPAQYLSKTTMSMRGRRTCDVEYRPYFVLGDLWESFWEWSAYGAGVPLVLNDSDCVVQYYVPYLSGIQIYVDSTNSSVVKSRLEDRGDPLLDFILLVNLCGRRLGEDSDSDFRDSSSDGSSDCEPERGMKYSREQWSHHCRENKIRMDRLSLRDQHSVQEDFSSDEGESTNSQGCLLFEYLERDAPYSREPLANKAITSFFLLFISVLASHFPKLKTLRSCDLLPSSWISVAWYPIYRIPTGPTLKDLDACFLTYHSLHTPMGVPQSAQAPAVTYPNKIDGVAKMSLPVFGLASYKFKGSVWTSNGGCERQLTNSLLQAADNWLRLLQVEHPDFIFFCRR
ncbi:hypothetical protein Pint_22098 [Pistacia integerrima]|uniref:Uncharacterized protein n=1 Tax=Pistacia integerrima TaxID=434235 RepID=A0ACC0YI42_9ROSI|nr:hypothetical protein Pint_22098 [Pistacia integerrima]